MCSKEPPFYYEYLPYAKYTGPVKVNQKVAHNRPQTSPELTFHVIDIVPAVC